MILTKENLKNTISDHLNIPSAQSSEVIESFLETIKSSLEPVKML